ncbi:unnamed protein product [Linum trigynum]|uniref:Uncharacterized protein n=1 Tax=Linum trigynum TaxID=586398 RepID=A0AAV2FZZ7_9ROSI
MRYLQKIKLVSNQQSRRSNQARSRSSGASRKIPELPRPLRRRLGSPPSFDRSLPNLTAKKKKKKKVSESPAAALIGFRRLV